MVTHVLVSFSSRSLTQLNFQGPYVCLGYSIFSTTLGAYLKPLYHVLEAGWFPNGKIRSPFPRNAALPMRCHPKFEVAGARFEGVAAR
jgi:hypothetical protein